MSRRARAVIALIGATVFWAGNYIFGAVAVTSMPPFSLTVLRWAIAVVPLVVIAQLTEHPDWRELFRHWKFLLLQGATGLLAYNLLMYSALTTSTPFAASLINAANPALIAIAALFVLREPVGWLGSAGIALAFFGVLVVLTDGDLASVVHLRFGAGDLLMLAAVAAWTVYTIAARRGPKLPPISQVAGQAVFVVAGLAVVAPFVGVTLPHDATSIASLVFIAVFPSILSYVLWNRALTVIPAGRAGVFLNLITLLTAIWALATGTPITWSEVLGGAAIIAGVVLTVVPVRAKSAIS